jgi:hypothetical protein
MKATVLLAASLALAVASPAQDAKLEALRQILIPTRPQGRPDLSDGTRGATPRLTVAKHELRDWIESRLPPDNASFNPESIAATLNRALKAQGLVVENSGSDTPSDQQMDPTGYVGPIKMTLTRGYLLVQTGLGVLCGYDESAYLYEWKTGRWQRRWESEQNDYRKDKYEPQFFEQILISPASAEHDYLILTLGGNPWCYSSWSAGLYYRLWRMGADTPRPKLLLDEHLDDIFGDENRADVRPHDVRFVFFGAASDTIHVARPVVRHYRVEHDKVTRIDSAARIPREFVDTWLFGPWEQVAAQSDGVKLAQMAQTFSQLSNWSADRIALNEMYADYPRDYLRHCVDDASVWQVRFSYKERLDSSAEKTLYFFVRWQKPDRFTMLDIRDAPAPACTQPDPDAEQIRNLFADR